MSLKTVYKAKDLIEAGLLIAMLHAHGIDAQHFDQHINTLYLGGQIFAPVRILVDEAHYQVAADIIEQHFNTVESSS